MPALLSLRGGILRQAARSRLAPCRPLIQSMLCLALFLGLCEQGFSLAPESLRGQRYRTALLAMI